MEPNLVVNWGENLYRNILALIDHTPGGVGAFVVRSGVSFWTIQDWKAKGNLGDMKLSKLVDIQAAYPELSLDQLVWGEVKPEHIK